MRRLVVLLALALALPAAASTYRVTFTAPLSDELQTPSQLIVYCPADKVGSLWFPERSIDPETGGWAWVWETDEISPRMARERFVVYGDDGFGHVTALGFIPAEGGRKTLSWGALGPPRVEAEGIYFDLPTGLDASLLDHLEAIRNGKPVKTDAGKLNLPPIGDGCTLATRAVLLGGKQFLQSMTISIEPKRKETA